MATRNLAPGIIDKTIYWQSKYKWYRGISSAVYRYGKEYNLCVIPPSPRKRYNIWPWENLIGEAKDILKNTSRLIFYGFGFSLTDQSLSSVLGDRFKTIKKIYVIDKNENCSKFQQQASKFLSVDADKIGFGTIPGL